MPLQQATLHEQSSSLSSQLHASISLCDFMHGGVHCKVCLKDSCNGAQLHSCLKRTNFLHPAGIASEA